MRPSLPSLLLLVLASVAAAGCQPKATFEVIVSNDTDVPLTIGIVKEGPPYEPAFGTPDDWSRYSPFAAPPAWGTVLPPQMGTRLGPKTGAFPQGALAYLRVYRGEHPNSMLIAMSQAGPDRLDILIYPGHSEFIVRKDESGALKAIKQRPPAPPPPPPPPPR
jgi:hypothetical protein